MKNKQWLLGLPVSFIMPFAFMLGKYAENSEYLYLSHVLLVSCLLGLFSSILFSLVLFMTKQPSCAAVCIALLGIFFFSKPLQQTLQIPFWLYTLPGLFFIAGITFCIWRLSLRKNTVPLFVLSSLFITTFLVLSLIPTLQAKIRSWQSYEAIPRKDFSIDASLPSPNIYWLHADGMIGFDGMEYFFDDAQEEFTQNLEDYGFILDRGAQFEAYHGTKTALPALFSPQFYDDYMVQMIEDSQEGRISKIMSGNRYQINEAPFDEIRKSNELAEAFEQKGYTTATIGLMDIYFYPTTNYYYRFSQFAADEALFQIAGNSGNLIAATEKSESYIRLLDLLKMTSLLPESLLNHVARNSKKEIEQLSEVLPPSIDIDPSWHEPLTVSSDLLSTTRGLFEFFQLPDPKLVIVQTEIAHMPFVKDENGNLLKDDEGTLRSYPGQHHFSSKYVLDLIDYIIEKDPEAIIVLQADHGPHDGNAVRDYVYYERGEDKDMMIFMWNSTVSAVRIPEIYGTPEDSIHPLNISRYLINHFVGDENYPYLEPDEIWIQ